MSEASQALQKIARGTGIVFAGTVISMFFGFLSRAIIARYFFHRRVWSVQPGFNRFEHCPCCGNAWVSKFPSEGSCVL